MLQNYSIGLKWESLIDESLRALSIDKGLKTVQCTVTMDRGLIATRPESFDFIRNICYGLVRFKVFVVLRFRIHVTDPGCEDEA